MKVKAHTRYMVENKRVAGVTTILGVLNKPNLIPWANRMGLKGIDTTKYVNEAAEIGTLAHEMVMHYFEGTECNTDDYSKNQIKLAENSLKSFYSWNDEHEITPILIEEQMASAKYFYGGTIDLFCNIDGVDALVDFKTGKAIYSEMFSQVAAYVQLLKENGHKPKKFKIIRIGRDPSEGFEERSVSAKELKDYWSIFYYCLKLYELKKKIR